MPLSPDADKAVKAVEELLGSLAQSEEAILQSSSRILGDNSISSVQRIQISNLFLTSSADLRNAITRIQQAVQQAKTLA